MKPTRLIIYATPVRWAMGQRQYFDKTTQAPRVMFYPKPELKKYKKLVAAKAYEYGVKLTRGPVALAINYYYARTGITKQKVHKGKPVPDGPIPRVSAPDLTNLTKALEDGLTGIAYKDDRQVFAHVHEGKWFVERGGMPRIEVLIMQYGEDDSFVIGADGRPILREKGDGDETTLNQAGDARSV